MGTFVEPFSVATVSSVGTECRPSSTICRLRWSKVIGFGRSTWIHEPSWLAAPKPGLHTVSGFPSSAAEAPALRSPGSRPLEYATIPEACWRPTRRSIWSSGISALILAVPVRVKVRALGSTKDRSMLTSGSWRGG